MGEGKELVYILWTAKESNSHVDFGMSTFLGNRDFSCYRKGNLGLVPMSCDFDRWDLQNMACL